VSTDNRTCLNCKGSRLCTTSLLSTDGTHTPWQLVTCRQKLSDHYKHYLELDHVCTWHSDSVKDDKRYPHWEESIDL
jgi:hypothetical protein